MEIEPREFVLARTLEPVRTPNDLMGLVEGRSSWARVGLGVHLTASKIDPGFYGTTTRNYLGLLTAVRYHGAAHHRSREFQVVMERKRPARVFGTSWVVFVARRGLAAEPVESLNHPRRTVLVSSVEATAVNIVGCTQRAGGLDRVAVVLLELD